MSDVASRRWLVRYLRALCFCVPFLSVVLSGTAAAAPANENEVIVPKSGATSGLPASPNGPGTGALTLVGVVVLAGAGAWLLWRARVGGLKQFNRVQRQLTVDETRSLGNRQYLVVASYQDKKFLLGVCPGRIEMLSALNSTPVAEPERLRS